MDTPIVRRVALVFGLVVALCTATPAQVTGADDESDTTTERRWSYSSRGPGRNLARASDPSASWWETGPWYGGVSAGPAWFGGDGLADSTDFAAEARVARDLTDNIYLLGSYTFAIVESEGDAALGGSGDEERHDLHIFTLGVGFRADVTPEVKLFIEPRAGLLFGSDADAAPVGALTGGVDVSVTEGIALRFAVTGLLTDSAISRDGPDANLESGVYATLGVTFEF